MLRKSAVIANKGKNKIPLLILDVQYWHIFYNA
jgi:hypothetical protein